MRTLGVGTSGDASTSGTCGDGDGTEGEPGGQAGPGTGMGVAVGTPGVIHGSCKGTCGSK